MRYLRKHAVTLALHAGLDRASNGDLIKAAEERGFDALVTPDRNLVYQQNLKDRTIAIVVLPSGRWSAVRNQIEEVVEAVDRATPGSYCEVPRQKPSGPRP